MRIGRREMMVGASQLDPLGRAATLLVRRTLGTSATLVEPELVRDGGRNVVVRCRLETPVAGVASVVVKQMKDGTTLGFTDWMCLRYLSGTPGTAGLVPRFYGGDVQRRLFVMEDLGDSRSLQDVLMGADQHVAERACIVLAVQYARLHAATMETERQFKRVRRDVPEATVPGRHQEAQRWLAGLTPVRQWLAAAGCAVPAGFDVACGQVAHAYAEPGPFLAFTHGDPAPTNNHLLQSPKSEVPSPKSGESDLGLGLSDDVRLLDFEYGGFRHALYDLTAWHVLCPLPEPLVQAMSRAYRAALSKSCPAARDDQAYDSAWSMMCAYRALAMLSWIPCSVLDENRSWVDEWTAREAVRSAIRRLREATDRQPGLAPLAETAGHLEQRLLLRWPELRGVD
ncbi:MAG: phosphotransferase family protein, partial [Chloroflexota bacterium]